MTNEEHLKILEQGVDYWNEWRKRNPGIQPDLNVVVSTFPQFKGLEIKRAKLTGADLSGFNLSGIDLSHGDLRRADLSRTNLSDTNLDRADLRGSVLSRADFSKSNIRHADLRSTDLRSANLCKADLTSVDLRSANLRSADLSYANLRDGHLSRASLYGVNLVGAQLGGARLSGVNLTRSKLRGADFAYCDLSNAIFNRADLDSANFTAALILETVFANVDLTNVKGLGYCDHRAPSSIDYRTLKESKNVPLSFWRGCGLPDQLIDNLPSLTERAINFYSCFISYSSNDQEFAERLHANLQDKGVRCWFAPHDLEIGAKILDGLDEAIRMRDKVLLILSEGAIASDWVEDEVTRAFAEERRRNELMLLPVRLDDAVMDTNEPWAGKLRDNRNIGDFTNWKQHDAYKTTFDRVLRDLKTKE